MKNEQNTPPSRLIACLFEVQEMLLMNKSMQVTQYQYSKYQYG